MKLRIGLHDLRGTLVRLGFAYPTDYGSCCVVTGNGPQGCECVDRIGDGSLAVRNLALPMRIMASRNIVRIVRPIFWEGAAK